MREECWQHTVGKKYLREDLEESILGAGDICSAGISQFDFEYVGKTDGVKCRELQKFITRYEWMGTLGQFPTHRFMLTYKDVIVSALVMSLPNAFSKLLGADTHKIERLISRGACVSWAPKNTASTIISRSIRWMVKNTPYRLFTAYSDEEAGEIGTVYQASNFYYLGQTFGAGNYLIDPERPEWGMFSDRRPRVRASYKVYAKELGINWCPDWTINNSRMNWDMVPDEVEALLRKAARDTTRRCVKVEKSKKHKYAYVLGATKSETKALRRLLEPFSKPYPKRGLV